MKPHLKPYAVFLVLTLAGCASLAAMFGLEPPKSFKDQLAYDYSQLAGFRNSITTAIGLQTISAKDAEVAQGYADQVRQGLDAARFASSAGCPGGVVHGLVPAPGSPTAVVVQIIKCDAHQTPIDQLALANKVLLELTKYLNQRGIK